MNALINLVLSVGGVAALMLLCVGVCLLIERGR